jgi:hypothetical protein
LVKARNPTVRPSLHRPIAGAPLLGAGGSGGPLCALRRAAPHGAKALRMRMISWIGRPTLNRPRSLGPAGFLGKLGHPIIVTEQQADPVDLLYNAFQRLDAQQRRRLLKRIA